MNLLANITIHTGDALALLKKLPRHSVECVVTSPPYWGLRDYRADGQLGLEETPEQYIRNLIKVFRQVRLVLKPTGTCWVNIGDSYAGSWGGASKTPYDLSFIQRNNPGSMLLGKAPPAARAKAIGIKNKDLVGIPWLFAFAMRKDGWYLRQDIIWHKPNGMPSSVTDRCTANHEYLFLLTPSARYEFDHLAIQEPAASAADAPRNRWDRTTETAPGQRPQKRNGRSGNKARVYEVNAMNPALGRNVPWSGTMRNKRSVWSVPTQGFNGEHYAVFPPKLIEPCILAGCRGGVRCSIHSLAQAQQAA